MRGKGVVGEFDVVVKGITPAYAGKSLLSLALFRPPQDHPRVCGEKLAIVLPLTQFLGSPPRMRGKADGAPMLAPEIGSPPRMRGKD